MEADGREPGLTLIDRLLARPQAFNLFQAMSLLERACPLARPIGDGAGRDEPVRLGATHSLAFEASDVAALTFLNDTNASSASAATPAFLLRTPAFPLCGNGGMLPVFVSEILAECRAEKDHALEDFLDIFHHRFLSFLYRSKKKISPGLHSGTDSGFAALPALSVRQCLAALAQLDQRSWRASDDARPSLRHAGFFVGVRRSMTGLQSLLSDCLGVKVHGVQFAGGWCSVDASAQQRLCSRVRATQSSGWGALGCQVWDQAKGLTLQFADLSAADFDALLPGGDKHRQAASLVTDFLSGTLSVQFELYARARQSPALRLGADVNHAARLGWTSVMAARGGSAPDPEASPGVPVRVRMQKPSSHAEPVF